jgi:DivIVA domain-containing protein
VDLDTDAFRLARPGAEGYEQHEVDLFVAQVREALQHRPPTMAPWEVRDKVFKTQRVHRGYDEHAVDDFLDKAEQALRAAHGEGLVDLHEDVVPARSRAWLVVVFLLVTLAAVVAAVVLLTR